MQAIHKKFRRSSNQRGFTLLEIMIAMGIGLFLLGALVTIVQSNKAVFVNQNQLVQLQDSERMAMTLMADVIQEAGYFPDPTTNTVGGMLVINGAFASSGQAITGTSPAGPPLDTISVRYVTAPLDGILNCSGVPNPNPLGGANILYVNQFNVNAAGQLICTVTTPAGATAYTLVNGVTNLRVYYGVKTLATAGNNADTYILAGAMSAANWSSVITVMLRLTFTNPLAAQQGQPPTITLQRVVNLMNQSGPST
jgi:type IV pilus assembly protein PilW